ncbi:MAG: ParB/RepB/Spo0J family partition protein [Bacillota bacterium]
MNKKRGLGKGLEALLPGAGGVERDGRLREIEIDSVVPNRRQPRKSVSREKLAELAESIREHGVVQPIVVRPLPDGKYEIIAGERRWRACGILEMEKIPAVVREYGDLDAAAVALIENIQRENLNPLEEAMAYKVLIEDFGLTQEDVSRRVGKSRPFVGNMVRLLMLPEEVQKMLSENKISAGHARAILGIQDAGKQVAAARRIIRTQMNVRQAESLVKKMTLAKKQGKVKRNSQYLNLERELNLIFPAQVKLREKKDGGGRVVIDFKTTGEMINFLQVMKESGMKDAP